MSLSWREQIRIAIAPQQVTLLRLSRGWKQRVLDKQVISCETNAATDAPWRAALDTLQQVLPTFVQHRSDVVVILSNHFMRYTLIPYSAQIATKDEDMALLRLSFQRIYGHAAEGWALRMSDHGHEQQRLASAVDQSLLDAITTICSGPNLNLRSIQPYLMAAFNQWRHRLDKNGWFALVETGRLCLAQFQQNEWRSVRTTKIGDNWFDELAALLSREKLLTAQDSSSNEDIPVYVFAPGCDEPNSDQQQKQAIELLAPATGNAIEESSQAPYAMALAG